MKETSEVYIFSASYDEAMYKRFNNAIANNGITKFVDESDEENISFFFTTEDGEKVEKEMRKAYPSSGSFFSDIYDEDYIVNEYVASLR